MRDGQHVIRRAALLLHPLPELFWILGVDIAQRCFRHIIGAEDHIAVQVGPIGGGRPFVADKGCEAAGFVVLVGRIDHVAPHRVQVLAVAFVLRLGIRSMLGLSGDHPTHHNFHETLTATFGYVAGPILFQLLLEFRVINIKVVIQDHGYFTHPFGVVGDRHEIQGNLQLYDVF